jgi:hypothetical protein
MQALYAEIAYPAHLVAPGGPVSDVTCGYEQVVTDKLFEGAGNLFVRAILQRVAEVLAVDLPVPEEGAQAGVEYTRVRGEGEGPDLRLVPELPDTGGVLRALAADVQESYDLGQVP